MGGRLALENERGRGMHSGASSLGTHTVRTGCMCVFGGIVGGAHAAFVLATVQVYNLCSRGRLGGGRVYFTPPPMHALPVTTPPPLVQSSTDPKQRPWGGGGAMGMLT